MQRRGVKAFGSFWRSRLPDSHGPPPGDLRHRKRRCQPGDQPPDPVLGGRLPGAHRLHVPRRTAPPRGSRSGRLRDRCVAFPVSSARSSIRSFARRSSWRIAASASSRSARRSCACASSRRTLARTASTRSSARICAAPAAARASRIRASRAASRSTRAGAFALTARRPPAARSLSRVTKRPSRRRPRARRARSARLRARV